MADTSLGTSSSGSSSASSTLSSSSSSAPATSKPKYKSSIDIDEAVKYIANAKRLVFFTGAGMSAESGIATFRSNGNGFWGGLRGKFAMFYFGTPLGWKLTPSWGFKVS